MSRSIGLDFGTTNSAIASASDGQVQLTRFPLGPKTTETFRSVLYFDPEEIGPDRRPLSIAGPEAIEAYLQADGHGRLLQSLKSYLASRLFKATHVYGHKFTLEALIGLIARDLRRFALAQFGELPERVVVGRPVRFVGGREDDSEVDGSSEAEIEAYALGRLSHALRLGGFPSVVFEYEPVAAAFHYESRLARDELVLIADFGGGTSDFCLMRVGPGVRARGRTRQDILGTEGVALAGDAFDSRIIAHLIAPLLGKGSHYLSQGKRMPVPPWLYLRLARWHHMSFLKSRETMSLLDDIVRHAERPTAIAALIHLIDKDLGYRLYQAVERAKVELSSAPHSRVVFRDGPLVLDEPVSRSDFESWIAPELLAIEQAVTTLLDKTQVRPEEVDAVFTTGGSSLVPAVQRIFARRFGEERLRSGGELTSVASGLALCGA
ncbi:MAG: Hsp70 family protein [Myxococcales bacterium]|nr:Hsp70 family protein [Myxococcales bacterium]